MHIRKFVGAALAVAMLCAFPASAAVSPITDPVTELGIVSPLDQAKIVCSTTFEVEAAILFVRATSGCNAALTSATGICMAPVINAIQLGQPSLPPGAVLNCPALRPPPPG